MSTTNTTCPYCGVGCGVVATVAPSGVSVSGDQHHPANFGRLCVKGSALAETVGLKGRMLQPQLNATRLGHHPDTASEGWQSCSWDQALDLVAQRFAQTIAEHGPDSVAFYVSGQLLTEDYYVANKLMKGFIGSANIDTNSRLCMSSAVAGHKRAFGEDVVPLQYTDLEQADLIVLVGSNAAWCHPVLFQRIQAARQARGDAPRVVIIDPRRTASCEDADLHLPIASGQDVTLFNALLTWLDFQNVVDAGFIEQHTQGFPETLSAAQADVGWTQVCASDAAARQQWLVMIAARCGLARPQLETFFQWVTATPKTITAFSMGVNQSSSGSDKVNAIINCHLATGRIGKVGSGPFSITGQPNAMGGREVGGLSNQLAAHLELDQAHHRELVQQFWNSPTIASQAGLKAVELFDAIAEGRIKAVWIMATNPVVSLPNADHVRKALKGCPFVVVSDIMQETDTSALAHVRLPATGWGERDGTVTNSERCISRQRPFLAAPGAAQHDWWMISQVAARLGYGSAFNYTHASEIFDEHARLSAERNHAGAQGVPRQFSLEGLVGLGRSGYDALAPIRWPVRSNPHASQNSAVPTGSAPASESPYASFAFSHVNRKARFVPVCHIAPAHQPCAQFPLILNTGRIRDHWHTMSRTGKSPRLANHRDEPYIEVHPDDARSRDLTEGALGRVNTAWGQCVARVRIMAEAPKGQVFVPIHWNDQTATSARVGALVNPVVDPLSGEPEFKHTPAQLSAFAYDWHGFLMVRDRDCAPALIQSGTETAITDISTATSEGLGIPGEELFEKFSDSLKPALTWWCRAQGQGFVRYEFAGSGELDFASINAALTAQHEAPTSTEYHDPATQTHRLAWLASSGPSALLSALLYVTRKDRELPPARTWVGSLFAQTAIGTELRPALLAGKAPGAQADEGPVVCSCHSVGLKTIEGAIQQHGLCSVQALGAKLKCGTGCGSCIPELKRLIATVERSPQLTTVDAANVQNLIHAEAH